MPKTAPASEPTGPRGAIETRLRELVDGLPDGTRLPSERELAERWGVARMTLRKGLDRLQRDGLLSSRHGAGTFVVRRPIIRTLGLTSFSEDMALRGKSAGSRLLDLRREAAASVVATALRVELHSEVFYLRRLRLADGEAIAIEESWLRADLVPGLDAERLDGSLYDTLDHRYGLRAASASAVVAASLATASDAAELGIDVGDPCLRVSLTDFTAEDVPFMIAECRYRADRYELAAELNHRAVRP